MGLKRQENRVFQIKKRKKERWLEGGGRKRGTRNSAYFQQYRKVYILELP